MVGHGSTVDETSVEKEWVDIEGCVLRYKTLAGIIPCPYFHFDAKLASYF